MTGRVADALTAAGASAYPRARRGDARVVRDCAREAVAAGGVRVLAIESVSLLAAGLRAGAGLAALEMRRAPWRAALDALTLPLATALLLVWTFGFVPRYDHWPLGEGWALLLGGSLTAVVGAALRSRWLTAGGAAAMLIAAAAPYVGFGTEFTIAGTPSFFEGWNVDFGASSLLPTLLLMAGALSLPSHTRPPARTVRARLAVALAPAAIATVFLLPYAEPKPSVIYDYTGPATAPIVHTGPPYPAPWLPPSRSLTAILAIALAIAIVVTWRESRAHPERTLATGLVLVSVAYPLTWVAIRTGAFHIPYWLLNGLYPLLLTVLPALLALALMRRGGRAASPRS